MRTTGAKINDKECTVTFQFTEADYAKLVNSGLQPIMEVLVYKVPRAADVEAQRKKDQAEWDAICAKDGHDLYFNGKPGELYCRQCGKTGNNRDDFR